MSKIQVRSHGRLWQPVNTDLSVRSSKISTENNMPEDLNVEQRRWENHRCGSSMILRAMTDFLSWYLISWQVSAYDRGNNVYLFRDVTSRTLVEKYKRFRRSYRLYLQQDRTRKQDIRLKCCHL